MYKRLRRPASALLMALAPLIALLATSAPPAHAADVTTVGLYQYGLALCVFGCTVTPDYTFYSTTYGSGNVQTVSASVNTIASDATLEAWIAPVQEPGTIPLYDCHIGNEYYFNSVDSNCDGASLNSFSGFSGVDGYIYTSASSAPPNVQLVPLYRCSAYFFGTQDWYMTSTNSACESVQGYSEQTFLGYGLASSYDYTASAASIGTGVTYPGCTSSITTQCTPEPSTTNTTCQSQPGTLCITISTQPAIQIIPCPGGVLVGNACLGISGPSPSYAGISAPPCLTNCGAPGTFLLTPPWPLPSNSLFQPHSGPPPYDTLIVGNALSTSSSVPTYSSDEANFVYTVLWLCGGDGADGPNYNQANFDQNVFAEGNLLTQQGSAASQLGLTEAQAEAGVVAWVPPQCLHWYVDAPLAYDQYHQELAAGNIPNSTAFISLGSLDNVQDLPGTLAGATCGSGAIVCSFSEQTLLNQLLPYELTFTTSLSAALGAGEQQFSIANDTFNFIQAGCPSGQVMVFNPSISQTVPGAAPPSGGVFVETTGVTLEPGYVECVQINNNCQSATSELFGSGASFDNWINFLMDPVGFGESANCGYTVESVATPDPLAMPANAEHILQMAFEGFVIDPPGPIQLVVPFAPDQSGNPVLQPTRAGVERDSRAPSSTSVVSSSADPTTAGSTVTYTAAVSGSSAPSGTVTFSDNNGAICRNVPVDASGKATCQANAGNAGVHYILAGYSGDSNLTPSFSPSALYQGVDPANQTITFTSPTQTTITYGSVSSFTAAASASSGLPVSLSVDASSSSVCTLSGSTVTILSAGTCTISAGQAGNSNYNPASGSLTVTIGKAGQTITFGPLSDVTYGDPSFTVSATGGGSGNPVTFASGPSAVCTATGTNGATISNTGVGTCTVTASQAGDTSYSAATPVSQQFQVRAALATVTLGAGDSTPFKVGSPGGSAGFSLSSTITATEGDLTTATVTYTLTPVGPGSSYSCTDQSVGSEVTGTKGGNQTMASSCAFSNVAVNVYTLTVTAGGNYGGSAQGVVTVYDPSLGFTTGGGTIVDPTTGYPANFGFEVKYLKSGNIQGNAVYVEHQPSGDVVLKSNDMLALSVVAHSPAEIAYIQGKATLNGAGGYQFLITAIDSDGQSSSTAPDQYGLNVTYQGGAYNKLTFSPVDLTGGNITVPHQ